MINVTQLQAILNHIEGIGSTDLQSPNQVVDYMVRLMSWLAFSAEQQALCGKALNIARRDAYKSIQGDIGGSKPKYSPLLAKEYVAALCSKEAYHYELAERCNRTVTHCMDAARSILSSIKSEMSNLRYSQ